MDKKKPNNPGAYIGQKPELAADRIPGGVREDDERVAANSSQSGVPSRPEPSGHREVETGDDELREAGQDR
jgi:hypothetical protein